jgi:THO complex subunit 4
VYHDVRDAKMAIREFDGANANGQPIRLSLVAAAQAARPTRNPFDTAIPPARSLADRIESPAGRRRPRDDDTRSASPPKGRRSDVTKPAPEHIDRYVPGQRSSRPRGGAATARTDSGRRPGARREQSNNQPRGREEHGRNVGGARPRKTAEELDAEMADYWGGGGGGGGGGNGNAGGAAQGNGTTAPANPAPAADPAPAPAADADVDMIS